MRQELLAGASVVLLAVVVLGVAAGYPLGTLARMGPGMFPLVSGIILLLIGIGICIQALAGAEADAEPVSLRPILAVFSGLTAWAVLAPWLGLVPATVTLVVATSLARPGASWMGIIVTSALLSAFGTLIFVYGLGVRLSVLVW